MHLENSKRPLIWDERAARQNLFKRNRCWREFVSISSSVSSFSISFGRRYWLCKCYFFLLICPAIYYITRTIRGLDDMIVEKDKRVRRGSELWFADPYSIDWGRESQLVENDQINGGLPPPSRDSGYVMYQVMRILCLLTSWSAEFTPHKSIIDWRTIM